VSAGARLTGAQVATLPAHAQLAYENAYVHALRPVFIVAACIAAVGFLLSLALRELPLRATAASSQGLEDALAAPKAESSLAELDRSIARLVSREDRRAFNEQVRERAGVDVSPGAVWALARFGSYGVAGTRAMARELQIDDARIAAVVDELHKRGLIVGSDGDAALTPAGQEVANHVISARREQLQWMLSERDGKSEPEVKLLLESLCVELAGQRP
jgi:DNA-binding MarR family transcriptional regulator